MNNLVQLLLGLVIMALMAVFAAPYFIDWNQYKSQIETQASRLVGRQLTVAGDVNLRLLPAPYLQLENITVAPLDATSKTPSLLTAQAFRLWLSAPPLLRGVIEVREIEIVKPHLRFAIDQHGQTNWLQNRPDGQSSPFSPTAVSLQSMTIIDGTLELRKKSSDNRANTIKTILIEDLNGGFSAGSLKGPYKFDGTLGKGANQNILRFSTGSIDDNNDMRVKSVLRSSKGGQRYGFDGTLTKLNSQPTLNGVLTASFPFLKSTTSKGHKGSPSTSPINRAKPIEIKASISANTSRALFEKILVTIVHNNRPQMMTGKGRLSWDKGLIDLDGNLTARLIDLDHLKDGMKVGNTLRESIGHLVANLQAQSAKFDRGRFNININQIKLNGDLIQDVTLNLQRDDQGLRVKQLFARLPGNNMIKLSGHFEGQSDSSMFKGNGVLRGASLGHFVTWMAGGKTRGDISAIRSRPFTLRGNLIFGDAMWALNGVHGDIAGTSFNGAISHKSINGGNRKKANGEALSRGETDLQLTTSEIDTTALIGRPLAMREIINSLLSAKPADASSALVNNKTASRPSLFAALTKNNIVKLKLRAGRLKLEDFDGRDLVVDMFIGLKRLQINEMSLRSQNGLRLQADGTIDNLEKTPSGTLTATINIEDDEELKQFLTWVEPTNSSLFTKKQIAALTPVRLAVMLQTSSNTDTQAEIRVNGVAGSSHIALNNRIIGTNLFSRQAQRHIDQLELTGSIHNEDGRALLTQLVPYLPIDLSQLAKIGDSRVWFSAAGLPEQGLNSRIEFNSKRVSAGLDGLLGWQSKSGGSFRGTTRLKTQDIASGLALIGVDARELTSSGSLNLSATLNKQGQKYAFSDIHGAISQTEVEGRATLELSPETKKIDVVLLTSALHMPSLFAPLLENPLARKDNIDNGYVKAALKLANNLENAVGIPSPIQNQVITNRRYSADLLQGIEARILITADKLFITDKIVLKNGDLSASIKNSKISFDNIGGKLWGGQMHSKGNLDLSKTLAKVSGDLWINNASIEKTPLYVNNNPIAKGDISLKLNFEGRGISPVGLISLLNGKGKITFSNTRINHLSSSVLTDIVDDELTVWKQSEDQTPFNERFRRHLLHADFNINSLSENFTIKDGSVLLKTAYISKNQSKLDLDASLILASMTTHSRLSISPVKEAKYADLPAASILLEGPLGRLDRITPKIDTASLEQHLKVMKMEHDVNLLEKLHKRDEEFAKKAAERRDLAKQQREQSELEQSSLQDVEPEKRPSDEHLAPPPPNNARPPNWNPFLNGN